MLPASSQVMLSLLVREPCLDEQGAIHFITMRRLYSYLHLLSSCDTYPADRPGLIGQLLSAKQVGCNGVLIPTYIFSLQFWILRGGGCFLLQFLLFPFVNHFSLFRIKTKQQFLLLLLSPIRFEIDNKVHP